MQSVVLDKGPWSVVHWGDKVGLQSDDFMHDVVLYVTGDFYDIEQQLEYARLLAESMNRMPRE